MAIPIATAALPRPASPLRVAPTNLFRRMSAQALGMKAAALCHRSHWVPKSSRTSCSNCRRSFRLWASKHHCRLCGEIVCGACSTKRILFQSKSVRTCDDCVDANVPPLSASIDGDQASSTALRDRDAKQPSRLPELKARLITGKRRLRRHHSSFAASSTTRLGSRRRATTVSSSNSKNGVETSCSSSSSSVETVAVLNYHFTFSRQKQIMSLAIAALVVLIGCAVERTAQIWM
uniref:FYVE-type domain-containing protein n=1 Tax=Hyaloperonospora arabidopsidis (strain Emoy2) TaxID=559515 RepID=M4BL08_HYAAE